MNTPRKLDLLHDDDLLEPSALPAPAELEFGPGSEEAIRHTCEAIGQIIESWGFKRIMGMTWAFLYLCPEPASAKDICKALSVSPALVSITVQDLIRWGVIKKLSPLGKRRDYYVAEHDIWKMIRKVLQERERVHMDEVRTKLTSALEALDGERANRPDLKSRRTCQFQRVRVEDLLQMTNSALRLLDILVEEGRMEDVAPIFSLLKPYQQLAKGMKVN
jgi:DNA-binding transcriptional regulator GbsR (MarR family)